MKKKYLYVILGLIIVVFITSFFPPFRVLYLIFWGYLDRQTLPTVDGPKIQILFVILKDILFTMSQLEE